MDRPVKRYRNRVESETHMTMTLYSNREKDRHEDHTTGAVYAADMPFFSAIIP